MRWLAAPALMVVSFLVLAMTGAVGATPSDRVWLFGLSLGAMFWAGLDVGFLLTWKARGGH